MFGGKPGIRTLGTLLTSNGFQDRRNRPLCQLPLKVLQQRCVSRHVIQYIANPTCRQVYFFFVVKNLKTEGWCAEGDSNPHARRHMHLKHACLPIPPSALFQMVGVTGFEPVTFRPPGERATELRYTPNFINGPRPAGAPKKRNGAR